jgi:hypothetical protein
MNKESKKAYIYSRRLKSLQKIATASQKEVERCLAEIDAAKTEEELSLINFTAPSMPENL